MSLNEEVGSYGVVGLDNGSIQVRIEEVSKIQEAMGDGVKFVAVKTPELGEAIIAVSRIRTVLRSTPEGRRAQVVSDIKTTRMREELIAEVLEEMKPRIRGVN